MSQFPKMFVFYVQKLQKKNEGTKHHYLTNLWSWAKLSLLVEIFLFLPCIYMKCILYHVETSSLRRSFPQLAKHLHFRSCVHCVNMTSFAVKAIDFRECSFLEQFLHTSDSNSQVGTLDAYRRSVDMLWASSLTLHSIMISLIDK